MCHRLSIEVCAHLAGRTIEETGTTTARPPVQPVPLGALAARSADPWKLTPTHHRHVEAGAELMDMGAWKRPLRYSSVDEECRAVREAVGIIDVSTLGKLQVVVYFLVLARRGLRRPFDGRHAPNGTFLPVLEPDYAGFACASARPVIRTGSRGAHRERR